MMRRYRFTIAFLLLVITVTFAVMQVLFVSLPFNPVQSTLASERYIQMAVPQGWAFFTRSAREPQVILYKVDSNTITPIAQQHSSASNYFGLKRASTRILTEMQVLRGQLNDEDFIDTRWNYQRDQHGDVPDQTVTVANQMKDAVICGEYLLVFQEHVPWAWAGNMEKLMMPAKAIKIKVTCN